MVLVQKLFVLVAFLSIGSVASAADFAYPEKFKVSYTLDTFLGAGDRIYYSCDSVESDTRSLLKKLGAENIRVSCSGGFDHYMGYSGPAYVSARFIAPTMTKNNAVPRLATVREVRLRGSDNCHFMSNTLEALSEVLEMNIKPGNHSCFGSRSNSNYLVRVLAFAE